MASEQQEIIENALLDDLRSGRISRRQFMQTMVTLGLGMGGVAALSACAAPAAPTSAPATSAPAAATSAPSGATAAPQASTRPLTPTFYQWIIDLHPGVKEAINPQFPNLNFQIAPTQGFDVTRFVEEGKNKNSTWDVYVGMTPFVEMAGLIKADVIEPWDNYIDKSIIDDLIPAIRDECTVNGKLYSWPFLLDIIVEAQNNTLVKAAGLDTAIPADWDTYLANSKAILDKNAAKYGCTFDAHGWRCLAPITHSISTKAYYTSPDDKSGVPLFDFTSDPAIQALQIMKQMLDLSSANALQPGTTDAGVNNTPDEVAFGAESVAYYVKYQNAPLRFATTWKDPKALALGALPKAKGGEGATVFWSTGACLFKWGQNKDKAAEYMKALTYSDRIWKDSISGSPSGHPGQLPPFKSIYAKWQATPPDWLAAQTWVPLVRGQLDVAKAIPNNAYGLNQFVIGQPFWEKYLKGEEKDPKVAMQAAKDAVIADIKKNG